MGYHGLFMGCAREYWLDKVQKINRGFGKRPFQWSEVYSQFPDISKSDLTRLRSSSWITMVGKDKKTGLWRLTDGAVRLCTAPAKPKIKTIRARIKPGNVAHLRARVGK